jgi:Protein of unknown function (DUF4229)
MTVQPTGPSFGRWMGALWLYTVLRVAVFGVLFGVLWLAGVPGFLGAVIAVVLSLPLSYVLLARPRAALSDTIEQRLAARHQRQMDLDARLRGDDGTSPEN